MNKTDVYSWRVSSELKGALQAAARREGASVSELLERLVGEFLSERRARRGVTDEEQRELHAAVSRSIGSIHGGDSSRSERAGLAVRDRLKRRRAG
jgi:ribbon-helix-helix CopG family protein